MATAAKRIELVYPIPETDPRWELEDDITMPESGAHDKIVELLVLILGAWVLRSGRGADVARNMALRWDRTHHKIGVDPDVMLIEPPPPGGSESIQSLCTWKPGHHPPRVAIEVVSNSTAAKDYGEGPDKYAASGTRELWVFDPERFGPEVHGGPYVLQMWRQSEGRFARCYAGEGPAYSEELGAWLVVTDDRRRLRIADDAEGEHLWLTVAEAALAEVERLKAEIQRLRGG